MKFLRNLFIHAKELFFGDINVNLILNRKQSLEKEHVHQLAMNCLLSLKNPAFQIL